VGDGAEVRRVAVAAASADIARWKAAWDERERRAVVLWAYTSGRAWYTYLVAFSVCGAFTASRSFENDLARLDDGFTGGPVVFLFASTLVAALAVASVVYWRFDSAAHPVVAPTRSVGRPNNGRLGVYVARFGRFTLISAAVWWFIAVGNRVRFRCSDAAGIRR
jgi:hypothetical protein